MKQITLNQIKSKFFYNIFQRFVKLAPSWGLGLGLAWQKFGTKQHNSQKESCFSNGAEPITAFKPTSFATAEIDDDPHYNHETSFLKFSIFF